MKIAFLGTKGVPNNYGGFEQFAEYLSVRLAARGHEVTVYNPSFHPYTQREFSGVRIERIFSPEKLIGGAANFIYDHLCLQHALRQDYDVIYEAGYHSVALSYKLLRVRTRKTPVIITNMDGLEWKRSKWNTSVQKLIRRLEAIAVKESPYLISDNEGIRQYYLREFKRDSFFIPYGADPVSDFDLSYVTSRELTAGNYFMLIARMEPENNIELILESYAKAKHSAPFLVVGNYNNGFGQEMFRKYSSVAKFVGSIYNKKELDALRFYSKVYCHGHSVGGTNPSLLEAMSCQSFIIAHDNAFNKGVLEDDALYFSTTEELAAQFNAIDTYLGVNGALFKKRNLDKISRIYNWEVVTKQHEDLFQSLIEQA